MKLYNLFENWSKYVRTLGDNSKVNEWSIEPYAYIQEKVPNKFYLYDGHFTRVDIFNTLEEAQMWAETHLVPKL